MSCKPELIVIVAGAFSSTFVEETLAKIGVTVVAMAIGTVVSYYIRKQLEK